ncbi:hypothetical protein HWV62_29392 [Athelia sp. TMB]|nr:hypothetical protein HWV62_29392 [Athelia sp. TMB]
MSVSYDSAPALSPRRPSSLHSSSSVGQSKEAPAEPAESPIVRAMEEARSKRPLLNILLFSVPVVLITVGLALGLLVYIFVVHDWSRDGSAIQTTADLQNLLTISQILTTVVGKTVSFIITVHVFQLASMWLKASAANDDRRPSPSQLGLLMSILQSGSIVAWLKACVMRARVTKESKRQSLPWPPLLGRAVTVIGLLLVISNGITLLDTWLHASSRAILITRTSPYASPSTANFGKAINETQCAEHTFSSPSEVGETCGLVSGSNGAALVGPGMGLQTLSNSSQTNSVVFTDDQYAIMVPSSLPNDTLLTSQCVNPNVFSPEAYLNLSCTGYPLLKLNTTAIANGIIPSGVVDPGTGDINDDESGTDNFVAAKTNPFSVAAVITSLAYYEAAAGDGFVGDTGFYLHGDLGGWNVVYCNVTTVNIQYEYTPPSSTAPSSQGGTYTTITTNLAPAPRIPMLVATGLDNGPILSWVPDRVDGVGWQGAGNYLESFALEMSRELMAFTAMLWQPEQVLSIQDVAGVIGSRVQIAPLALYVGAVLLYAIIAFAVAILAIIESHSTPFAHLAHMRLTSTLAYIHGMFGPIEATRTWEKDGLEVFSTETEADRLNVGTVNVGDGADGFGVSRPAKPEIPPLKS